MIGSERDELGGTSDPGAARPDADSADSVGLADLIVKDATDQTEQASEAALLPPASVPLRVLIVDDDEDDYLLTADLLAEADPAGYELSRAADFDAGVAALRAGRADVALVDYRLGGRNGVELLRVVQGDPAAPPVVLLTGQGDALVDRAAMEAGAADYLNKTTLDATTLERTIRYAVALRRAEHERATLAEARAAKFEADVRREEAEAANRAKDDFLALLSHELRTPLNAVLGWVQLLKLGDVDAETTAQALDAIERNARTQAQLVGDLLDVSRIVAGKIELRCEPLDLAAVARAAVEACLPTAKQKNVALRADLPGEAPMVGDAVRLQQVLWNLLNNAVKFTPAGGEVRLQLEAANGQDAVHTVTVNDDGEGIDAQTLPHVFERFRQADGGSARQHGGLGLGLSLVKHLVEAHGGSATARSDGPGQGSTFAVRLPRQAPAGGRAADEKPPPRRRPLEGLRIMVVEDEDDARLALAKMLRRLGCRVSTHAAAKPALTELDDCGAGCPDVLLTDIGMPEMDGFALIDAVRQRPALADLPVYAVTAYTDGEHRRRAGQAGFARHVGKPVDVDALVAALAETRANLPRFA